MPLPNLIVIGAQKCGTTALHRYLGLHPEIAMAVGPESKELNFFSHARWWERGVGWYAARFADAPVRGEASPGYADFPNRPLVPERMAAVVPEARFVYLVRDPIDRLVSDWYQYRVAGAEIRPFEQAIAADGNVYLARSRYALQLERYRAHFADDRILVVDQHDLRYDRAATLRRIFRFAGVDGDFESDGFADEVNVSREGRSLTPAGRRVMRVLHRTAGRRLTHALASRAPGRLPALESRAPEQRPEVGPELRARLTAVLAPDVERLRALTGEAFANWSV